MLQASPSTGQDIVHFEVRRLVNEWVGERQGFSGRFVEHLQGLLRERVRVGQEKYGTALTTFNSRNAVQDSWEEAADLVYYLQQKVMELRTVGSPLERIFFTGIRDEALKLMVSLTALLPGVPE